MSAPSPTINSLVEAIFADSGAAFASRVEDVADGDLVVAGPPAGSERKPRLALILSWAVDHGRLEQAATLVEEQMAPQRTWRVRLDGAPRRSNRRNYVRVQVAHPVTIVAPGRTVPVAGIDLSEGGLRCRLGKPQPDEEAETGDGPRMPDLTAQQFTVRFELEGEEFTLGGTVVRSIPVEDGGRELGIRGCPGFRRTSVAARCQATSSL